MSLVLVKVGGRWGETARATVTDALEQRKGSVRLALGAGARAWSVRGVSSFRANPETQEVTLGVPGGTVVIPGVSVDFDQETLFQEVASAAGVVILLEGSAPPRVVQAPRKGEAGPAPQAEAAVEALAPDAVVGLGRVG